MVAAVGLKKAPEQQGTWRVWFIVALWALLIAQFAVDRQFRSDGQAPYPTITMPAFSAEAVGADERARVTGRTIQVIDGDQTARTVNVSELLAPLHSGPASSTFDRLFTPSADGASVPTVETVEWLKARTIRLGLTPDPVGIRIVWQPAELDIRTGKWTPIGEATVREVRW